MTGANSGYEYIVVGSGAGGGPVAAGLSRQGFRVLLIEAGGRASPPNYKVPAFHAFASEDSELKWDYFVRHYSELDRSKRDNKFIESEDGVLYPRAGTLGGCTAHHAMIMVTPHESDWQAIADETGDENWGPSRMRRYFKRLESKQYWSPGSLVAWIPWLNPGNHGNRGWLPITTAPLTLLLGSPQLLRIVFHALMTSISSRWVKRRNAFGFPGRLFGLLAGVWDVNGWKPGGKAKTGAFLIPTSIAGGKRRGTRELLEAAEREYPDNLTIMTDALVTSLIYSEDNDPQTGNPVVEGVRLLRGAAMYRAAAGAHGQSEPRSTPTEVTCTREVVVSAGAFNTPQLLMLSGIGPARELKKHGIPTRVDRPGVGANLQDRYEVGVVAEIKKPFALTQGAKFRAPDEGEQPGPLYRKWLSGEGPYTTNGALISIIRHSVSASEDPDLYCFGLVGGFRGYYPGYSQDGVSDPPRLTWAILKGHTRNHAGRVRLNSADPRDRPQIDFRYFDEGSDGHQSDLAAMVDGVRFARAINDRFGDLIARECVPGPEVRTDDEIAEFVNDNAWGHHASCTCRIGRPDDPLAVVDSRFKVFGVNNLRIVDASVFPTIPGFFIALPTLIVAERAVDVIVEDSAKG